MSSTDINQAKGNKILEEFDTHISYPFPLENGKVARLYMPLDITKNDVARIVSLIEVLNIDDLVH